MKTPKEIQAIQAESNNLQKQRDDLAKKLADLRTSAVATARSIQERAESISDAFLNGLPVEEDTGIQTKEKEKLEGLKAAIASGEKTLAELGGLLTEANRSVQHLEYDPIADEIDALALSCLDKLYSANTDFTTLDKKFKEIREIGAKQPGIPLSEHLEHIERMYNHLRAAGTMGAIPYKLNEVEVNFATALREAREKKGK